MSGKTGKRIKWNGGDGIMKNGDIVTITKDCGGGRVEIADSSGKQIVGCISKYWHFPGAGFEEIA